MNWLGPALDSLDHGRPALLVVITSVRGSAPREAGASLLVTQDRALGTLGGGTLEFRAIELARALLARGGDAAHVRVPLGPSLGQCCGGAVTLAFKRLVVADRGWLDRLCAAQRQAAPVTLAFTLSAPVPIEAIESAQRVPATGTVEIGALAPADATAVTHDGTGPVAGLISPTLTLRGALLPVLLFGAGHVGRAVAQALAPLPVTLRWVDERADEFPAALPANATREVTDTPLAELAAAARGSAVLVMTHLHSLDEALAEAALARDDLAFVGVIGSAAKRARFVRRLAARGMNAARIARMQMPIGAVATKEPAVIAACIAAELMQLRARLAAAPENTFQSTTHAAPLPWTSSGPTSSTG